MPLLTPAPHPRHGGLLLLLLPRQGHSLALALIGSFPIFLCIHFGTLKGRGYISYYFCAYLLCVLHRT
jgi:hypothetical protein